MISLTGIGHCSSLGLSKKSLQSLEVPAATSEMVSTKQGSREVSILRTPEFNLNGRVSDAVERRMSRLSKMCFYSSEEALKDCCVLENLVPERTGLIVGTAFGNLDFANQYQKRIILNGPMAVSPNLFTSSIPSSLASYLSLTYNIQGSTSTVTTMGHTTEGCFHLAFHWLKQDIVDRVLVVIGDEISDYHLYFGAHEKCSLPLAEGAVAFVLEKGTKSSKQYGTFENFKSFFEKSEKLSVFDTLLTKKAFGLAYFWTRASSSCQRA